MTNKRGKRWEVRGERWEWGTQRWSHLSTVACSQWGARQGSSPGGLTPEPAGMDHSDCFSWPRAQGSVSAGGYHTVWSTEGGHRIWELDLTWSPISHMFHIVNPDLPKSFVSSRILTCSTHNTQQIWGTMKTLPKMCDQWGEMHRKEQLQRTQCLLFAGKRGLAPCAALIRNEPALGKAKTTTETKSTPSNTGAVNQRFQFASAQRRSGLCWPLILSDTQTQSMYECVIACLCRKRDRGIQKYRWEQHAFIQCEY